MIRLLYALPLLMFSCALAALYGAIHNQISYTVAPVYFHEFKFRQFWIEPMFQNRQGAALVGAFASWWMGLVLGVPIFLVGLFIKGSSLFWRSYLKASCIVVLITLLVGLVALAVAYMTIGPDNLPWWMDGRQVSDPAAFARAGVMHDFSYLGGGIGACVGLGYMLAIVRKSRTNLT